MNSSSHNTSTKGGLGLWGTICVVLIILKLFDLIEWSWLWVLFPLWAPIALFLAILVIGFATLPIRAFIEKRKMERKINNLLNERK